MEYKFIVVSAYFKKAEDQTGEVAQPVKTKAYDQKDKNSEHQTSGSRETSEHFVRQWKHWREASRKIWNGRDGQSNFLKS